MPRRAAVKGTRRPRKRSPPSMEASVDDGATKDVRPEAPTKVSDGGGGFFCCYLLRSLCPRLKGRTYIGFTVNPRRRIRQHNGEISSGAWRTRKGRPWEMVLCIHGFPTNVAALQFEWAWQHPKESLALRKAAAEFKSLSGTGNKVKLVYTMLNLPSWEKLNLTVNFFSSASIKFAAGCPPLPSQMKTVICLMEDLQCHAKAIREACSRSSQEDDINNPQVHQGQPDCPHRDQQPDPSWSWKQRFSDIGEGSFPCDDFASMDGIHDLTEPDSVLLTEPDGPPRTSSQCSLSSDGGGDGVVEDKLRQLWKQQSSDELLPVDAQTRPAVHDVQEDSFSDAEFASMESDGILDLTEADGITDFTEQDRLRTYDAEFASMESDGILDLTEPDGMTDFTEQDRLRTSPQCSLSSDGGGDEIIEHNLHQVSPMWKVCDGSANGGDGRVVDDELGQRSTVWNWNGRVLEDEFGQALSPMWKACADSYDELRQASPMLKVGADSDYGDSGVTDDELGQACLMPMVDAGSEEGERVVVDLVTPTPVGRLWRRAGAGDCPRIIDLTASPVVIQL